MSAPASIGIVMHDFPLGGTERIALRLARAWAADGVAVTIFCGHEAGPLRGLVPDDRAPRARHAADLARRRIARTARPRRRAPFRRPPGRRAVRHRQFPLGGGPCPRRHPAATRDRRSDQFAAGASASRPLPAMALRPADAAPAGKGRPPRRDGRDRTCACRHDDAPQDDAPATAPRARRRRDPPRRAQTAT